MIQIRTATIEDAQHIALLGRITFTETFSDYFRDPKDLFDYFERTFSVAKIRNSIQNPNNKFWIAFWNELPIGYAKLKVNSPTAFIDSTAVSQLQKIYVLKEFLDKKAGKALMDELMDSFERSEQQYIWLSVLNSNERALHFYDKNGYSRIGEHQFSIGKEDFNFFALSKQKI
ncbi:GNAT family N-acetyltransferase [Chryseobacterium sp. Marseille-Q3244]|uniref:GNAT family N-acetyltransferase n=1 Tax=Chryseobacterium sp. Marseille-Q3244 TaxID=2758092 RepID=UPI0020240524|nr:GNAT family N-acetyltransferase [Chryseobacterium sp. Marseille-Q3244]